MLGQTRMSLLRFGKAKRKLSSVASRGAAHHSLRFGRLVISTASLSF